MPDSQRVAIVTGAGRGIGEAIARELAARSFRIVSMSPSGAARRLAEALGGAGLDGTVTEASDVEALVALALERYGRIDAVVNNSGKHRPILSKHGYEVESTLTSAAARLTYDPDFEPDILSIPDAAWHEDMDLMVLNCVRMARAVTPHLLERGGGAIVNISGMEASQPRLVYPLGPVRLALHGFTKLYSDRYARRGIRMNCVLPGVMENVDYAQQGLNGAIPMNRLGGMAELAKTVAFLLSEDAGYITGQMILVDGGLNRGL